MIPSLLYIWYEELRSVMRNKGVLIFILFVPIFYPLLYSYVYTNEVVREVPAVVVNESKSELSREFIRKVDATPDVEIVAHCHSVAEAQQLLQTRSAYGIIHIPASFEMDLWNGDQTTIGLYTDMSSMLYYKALLLAATDVSLEMNRKIKVERYLLAQSRRDEEVTQMPIEYDHISAYNPQGGFASFLIPPVLMLIIQQTLLLGIGMQMGDTREKYRGWVIPQNRHYKIPARIIVGKALVYMPIYFVMAIYMFTFVTRSFALPTLGHYLTLLAFIIPYLFSCIFFAIFLSFFIYRREDCILIFVFLSVPLLFLSGISWPGAAIPLGWKWVAAVFPSTFGINAYVRIMNMGCSLSDVGKEMNAIYVQMLVYFSCSVVMYWREMRSYSRMYHGK